MTTAKEARPDAVNAITLSVVWSGLLSIAEEMGSTLKRTAFSSAVREGEDFSTGVFDRQGRLIAQGNFTPGHLGAMPFVVRSVIEVFPEGTLAPGDGVLVNDSGLGSGHFPDFFLVSPVFLDERDHGRIPPPRLDEGESPSRRGEHGKRPVFPSPLVGEGQGRGDGRTTAVSLDPRRRWPSHDTATVEVPLTPNPSPKGGGGAARSPGPGAPRLIGFVVNTAHHMDVGGAAPGSQKVQGVTEAYQEGIRVLPVKAVRGGAFDEDILRIILGNVRLPDIIRGDLSAQRNANLTGSDRLARLYREHGEGTVEASIERILDRSEERMRGLLAAMPAGTYSFEDYLDDCGPGDGDVKVAVDVTIGGGEITVDFSRSSDAVPVAINSYLNYTRAYTLFGIKVFSDARLPQNDGMLRPIRVKAREGSFFNPQFPAPSGGRAAIQIRIFEAINGAMAKAMPERAVGAFSHWSNPNVGGIDDRTGKPFILYDLIFGGYGGRATKDGAEALSPVLNCANVPIEVHETLNPVLIRRFELIPDSGGAGQFRGGLGVRKDVELRTSKAMLTLLSDRHKHPPYGLKGGKPGRLAETILVSSGRAEQLTSKGVREIGKGDVVSYRLNGAGGYGDPARRDAKAIAADLADGYITPEEAARSYGYKG